MAEKDSAPDADDAGEGNRKKKKSRLPLMIGLVGSLALGGGGFFAAYSGMLDGLLGRGGPDTAALASGEDASGTPSGNAARSTAEQRGGTLASTTAAFVELEPLIVSLGSGSTLTHLRFRAHLEVASGSEASVLALMPRVMDVLNGYLRALRPEELADPKMLIRVRAQMLRRVQLVIGENLVKDLLVAEFVLN